MKSRTILLVEDNPSDIALTRRALGKNRQPVNRLVVSEDGQDALEYLFGEGRHAGRDIEDTPAMILLDLNLPRINGLEVLRRIRTHPHTRRLPVIILTTSLEERDLEQSYDLHANSYIRKPVDYAQFSEAIINLEHYWLSVNEPPPPVK